mmetsp:Transcript_14891/g.46920  ORF Transcript_14891/g.46920 Transcript_14891/m.46920 type:complete len:203 (-) Transcript_14891:57-665(-)
MMSSPFTMVPSWPAWLRSSTVGQATSRRRLGTMTSWSGIPSRTLSGCGALCAVRCSGRPRSSRRAWPESLRKSRCWTPRSRAAGLAVSGRSRCPSPNQPQGLRTAATRSCGPAARAQRARCGEPEATAMQPHASVQARASMRTCARVGVAASRAATEAADAVMARRNPCLRVRATPRTQRRKPRVNAPGVCSIRGHGMSSSA